MVYEVKEYYLKLVLDKNLKLCNRWCFSMKMTFSSKKKAYKFINLAMRMVEHIAGKSYVKLCKYTIQKKVR